MLFWFDKLFFVVDTFYSLGHAGEDFVGDGIQFFSEFGDRNVSSEDFNLVADFCINIGDIDHAGVHANIADDRCPFPSHEHFSDSVAQVAVQAVRIADRDDGDVRGTESETFTSIPGMFLWEPL